MRQRSVVFDGGVRVADLPFVKVEQGEVLAKTIYVYVGQLERSIINHAAIPPRRVILGSSGVVKAIETTSNDTSTVGKYLVVSPLSRYGVLAYNIDGLLANYSAVKPEHVLEELVEADPHIALKPLVAHGVELGLESEGTALIAGCNLVALSAALTLRESSTEPVMYCESSPRPVAQLGLSIARHMGNLPSRVDSVILTEPGVSIHYKLLKHVDPRKVIVSPLSLSTWIPVNPRVGKTVIVYLDSVRNSEPRLTDRILRELSGFVKRIEIDDVEKAVGLLPPQGLGFILVLRH